MTRGLERKQKGDGIWIIVVVKLFVCMFESD